MPKCPLCDHALEHVETTESPTHVYICPECSFVGFEFLNKDNIEGLRHLLLEVRK